VLAQDGTSIVQVVEPQCRHQERRDHERQAVEHQEPLGRAAPRPILHARHQAESERFPFDVATSGDDRLRVAQLLDPDVRVASSGPGPPAGMGLSYPRSELEGRCGV
jgi:hypothetical protein